MQPTLEQLATAHDNDYSGLEDLYRGATGAELVSAPFESARRPLDGLTLSASVIIPAWKAGGTLEQCLIAIEQSSFNRRYPDRLEVIVVDDGSTDGTWGLLDRLRLGVRLRAVRQEHHGASHARNTGIALAGGDVIVACDADMILAPFAIEELVKRHQVLDRVVLLGFRGEISPADPRLQPDVVASHLPWLLPPFERDIRLSYHVPGWPESICRDSDHLKRLGNGRRIAMPDGGRWDLPGLVFGALFSIRRDDLLAMGGFDERFHGWGCEDTLIGVQARALGRYIIPVYSAAGWHVSHDDRSPRKWRELAINSRLFDAIRRAPYVHPERRRPERRWTDLARSRIRQHFEREHHPDGRHDDGIAACTEAYDEALADPVRRGRYLHALGRYDEAADAFSAVRGSAEQESWALFDLGKALRAVRRAAEAIPRLAEAAARLPASPWPLVELGLALAAEGEFGTARDRLEQARARDPGNGSLAFLLDRAAADHLARAALHSSQGDHGLALQDYEIALILDHHNAAAQIERAAALAAVGRADQARDAIRACADRSDTDGPSGATLLARGRLHLTLGQPTAAKVALERARRLDPRVAGVAEGLASAHTRAAASLPLPHARTIGEQVRAIPGWFADDELDLLIALVLRSVAGRCADHPSLLVEIGSYCGRATTAMALTARGLGRDDVRIIAVDDPTLGPAPDGRAPRAVLRETLSALGLAHLVIFAPEDEPAPWKHTSHLLLIDGEHHYEGVRRDVDRYTPRLAPDGLLLFHDYADYFPDVQRCVEEVMLTPGYDFVAQAGSLIALVHHG
jgi:glycosyltransferase involved in cell wall biosynthesis/tetratricopeptide (TPR) repeat protein